VRRRLILILALGAGPLPALPALSQSGSQEVWSGDEYVLFSRPAQAATPAPPPAPERIEQIVRRFPSGKVQFDGSQLGRVKVGIWREFDRSGNLIVATPYVLGVLHGEVIRYHTRCATKSDPPAIAARTYYRFNVKDGPHTEFPCSGVKSVEGQHVDGVRQGVWRWYREGKDGPVVARQTPYACKKCDDDPGPDGSAPDRARAVRAFLDRYCTPARVQSMAEPRTFDCDEQGLIEWKRRLRCRVAGGQRVCGLRARDAAAMGAGRPG
jgi:hypothetical protein